MNKDALIKFKNHRTKTGLSLLAVFILLCAVLLSACAPVPAKIETAEPTALPTAAPTAEVTPQVTDTPVSEVHGFRTLSIWSPTYGKIEESAFDITETLRFFVDDAMAGDEKTVEFAGKRYELQYEQTGFFALRNLTAYDYSIKDKSISSDNRFRFLPDGTLLLVSIADAPIVSVEIGKNADAETVRTAVEQALAGEVDFARFDDCIVVPPEHPELEGGFYELFYQQKRYGIDTAEELDIQVDQKGGVHGVMMNYAADYGFDSLPREFDPESCIPAVEAKLNELYSGMRLAGHSVSRMWLTNIEGTPAIVFTLRVELYLNRNGGSEKVAEQCQIAVMLDP